MEVLPLIIRMLHQAVAKVSDEASPYIAGVLPACCKMRSLWCQFRATLGQPERRHCTRLSSALYCALLGCVMAVLDKQRIRFGPFEVDLHSGELFRDGIRLKLQPQPIQVLGVLLEHPGELVTREELHKRLWSEHTFVDFEQGLNTAIKKLRQALCDEAETPHYIETLPRRGYRFIAAPSTDSPKHPQTVTPPDSPTADSMTAQPFCPRTPWLGLHLRIILLLAGVVVVVLLTKISYRQLFPVMPRVIGSRQLTHTRLPKSSCFLATDGTRVYFQENHGTDQWILSQVSVAGGETSELPSPLTTQCLLGISPSGSELLLEDSWPHCKFWSLPIPAGTPRLLPIPPGSLWPVWSPDSSSLFFTESHATQLVRIGLDGANKTRVLSAPSIHRPRISPDGKQIRFSAMGNFSGPSDIWQIGIDGSNPHLLFPEFRGRTFFGDWTPDGKLYFFYRSTGLASTLWATREKDAGVLSSQRKPVLLYAGPLQLQQAIASKNGKELYTVGIDRRGEAAIYDPHSSTFVPFLGGLSASDITFSSDGQWIAYVSYPEGSLWRSRVDGSEKMQLTFPPMGVLLPRFSPDGKFIAFMEWFASEHHAIYMVSADGGQPHLLLSDGSEPADPSWSPDRRFLAYGTWPPSAIHILDLTTMTSASLPANEALFSPRWSPDGNYIVADTIDSKLWLYNFAQKQWRMLPGSGGSEAWSHNSKFVYALDSRKIIRVNISTNSREDVLDLTGIRFTSFGLGADSWFGLTPDDRVIIVRDTGTEEIYALELEY